MGYLGATACGLIERYCVTRFVRREAAAAAAAVSGAGNALLARGARSLVAAARRHLAEVAARLAREEEVADMVAEGADMVAEGADDEVRRWRTRACCCLRQQHDMQLHVADATARHAVACCSCSKRVKRTYA